MVIHDIECIGVQRATAQGTTKVLGMEDLAHGMHDVA